MSRLAVVYVVKAMERTAAGTTTASPPRGRAADHDAPRTIRAHSDTPSLAQRLFAAVSRSIGGAPRNTAHRRPGRAVRAD